MVEIYTETLARLYLKQGFPDRAVAIYRRLVAEQPENPGLMARLRDVERQIALGLLGQEPAAVSRGAPPASPVPPPTARTDSLRPVQTPVIAQLERWLQYLRTQRLQPTYAADARHVEV